jgi:hypothetical protein
MIINMVNCDSSESRIMQTETDLRLSETQSITRISLRNADGRESATADWAH